MSILINAEGIDRALKEMEGALDAIGGNRARKAIANAINQALAKGRQAAAREARMAYTAPIKKLFNNIDVTRARGGELEGSIEFMGSPGVSLIHFKSAPKTPGPRPKAGVTSKVKRKGSRYAHGLPGHDKPFIMKKSQGGYGVFVRKHGVKPMKRSSGRGKYYWGEAVQMLLGPSPIQALQRKDSQEHVAETIEEAFRPRLQAEIDKLLANLRSK